MREELNNAFSPPSSAVSLIALSSFLLSRSGQLIASQQQRQWLCSLRGLQQQGVPATPQLPPAAPAPAPAATSRLPLPAAACIPRPDLGPGLVRRPVRRRRAGGPAVRPPARLSAITRCFRFRQQRQSHAKPPARPRDQSVSPPPQSQPSSSSPHAADLAPECDVRPDVQSDVHNDQWKQSTSQTDDTGYSRMRADWMSGHFNFFLLSDGDAVTTFAGAS